MLACPGQLAFAPADVDIEFGNFFQPRQSLHHGLASHTFMLWEKLADRRSQLISCGDRVLLMTDEFVVKFKRFQTQCIPLLLKTPALQFELLDLGLCFGGFQSGDKISFFQRASFSQIRDAVLVVRHANGIQPIAGEHALGAIQFANGQRDSDGKDTTESEACGPSS